MQIQELSLNPEMVAAGDPHKVTLGQPVVEGGHVVEEILYHPRHDLYNKGKELGRASYSVKFAGIPERRVIFEEAVVSMQLGKEVKATKVPDLPE